ncbi:MAG TPA: DUF2868 domain-containing protein, partial [Casimicrobiaceae bacterium]
AWARVVRAFAWRPWITPTLLAAAFVAGFAVDHIGAAGRVNVLAPPVLGVLAWNIAVYIALVVRHVGPWRARSADRPGPLRRALAALAVHTPRAARGPATAPLRRAIAAFIATWTHRTASLYAARATRTLHLGAAFLAAGLLAGMYLRGLAFEYRASWQSTFLGPDAVHTIVAAALAPGAWLTGLAVPDVAHIASIRAGADPGSENAARWVHLYAATVAIVVIVPRLALALMAAIGEWRRAKALALPLGEPYFRALLRSFEAGPYRIRVVPYSFTLTPLAQNALRAVIARGFGALGEATVAEGVAYGAEDAPSAAVVPPETSLVIALFNAAATPETEAHGAFARALTAEGRDVLALVDESALRARWPDDAARLERRRAAWREVLDGARVACAFVDLASPDLPAAEIDITRAAARSAH